MDRRSAVIDAQLIGEPVNDDVIDIVREHHYCRLMDLCCRLVRVRVLGIGRRCEHAGLYTLISGTLLVSNIATCLSVFQLVLFFASHRADTAEMRKRTQDTRLLTRYLRIEIYFVNVSGPTMTDYSAQRS